MDRSRCLEQGGKEKKMIGAGRVPHSPVEPKMVLSVTDEGWAGNQEMSLQVLPSPEYPFCGGLGRRESMAGSGPEPLNLLSPINLNPP
jgi:hypothetical protein